jgi:hypothetical protein
VKSSIRPRLCLPPKSAFAGFRFPSEVIVVAVRWYLRFNLLPPPNRSACAGASPKRRKQQPQAHVGRPDRKGHRRDRVADPPRSARPLRVLRLPRGRTTPFRPRRSAIRLGTRRQTHRLSRPPSGEVQRRHERPGQSVLVMSVVQHVVRGTPTRRDRLRRNPAARSHRPCLTAG